MSSDGTSSTVDFNNNVPIPRYLLLHYYLPPFLHWMLYIFLILYIWFYILCFRVIYIVGHNIAVIEEHDCIIRTVMMLVYTEDSMLVLSIYPLRDLLSGQNYQLVCRYFANLYINSLLGSNMFWYLNATFYYCVYFSLFFEMFLYFYIFLLYMEYIFFLRFFFVFFNILSEYYYLYTIFGVWFLHWTFLHKIIWSC